VATSYQIANGYMGYRRQLGTSNGPEEAVESPLPESSTASGRLGGTRQRPNGGFTRVSLDGVELSALGGKVRKPSANACTLPIAMFERETVFASRTKTLTIKSSRFPERRYSESRHHRVQPHLRQSGQGPRFRTGVRL